ncbi:MAG TPA: hypothetical protein VMW09_09780 [Desulfatiglandales bacterium]|nr:hypothetical protein [Desulfatiglandales bacterium]
MPEDFVDIDKEEARSEEMAARELVDALGINLETFDVLASLFGELSGRVKDNELEQYQNAHMNIAVRMVSDLRTIKILICKGWTPQAAVVASTLLEESLNIRYIGSDNCKAQKWFSHTNEKHPVWRISFLLEELKNKTGEDLEPVWRRFCQIKHYNPRLARFFHIKVLDGKIIFHPGPLVDKEDNVWKEYILMWSSALVVDTLKEIYQSFMKYHISPEEWEKQFKALELKIREFLRKKSQESL